MLFQKQKRHDRMRAQPHKTRHPPPKHPAHALDPIDPAQQPPQPLLLLRGHDPRLHHVHGTTDRGSDKPGQETGAEMRGKIILERGSREDDALAAIVTRELARGHEHGAHAVGQDAAEERAPAFVAGHADEAVERVGVVAAGGRGEGGVVLHADVEDVGGVAGYAA